MDYEIRRFLASSGLDLVVSNAQKGITSYDVSRVVVKTLKRICRNPSRTRKRRLRAERQSGSCPFSLSRLDGSSERPGQPEQIGQHSWHG